MIRFEINTRIHRPLVQVFQFVTTPENDFQWQYGTLSSTRLSQGEFGLGSSFRVVGHFLGRRMESVFEVTRFEPQNIYAYKTLSGSMPSQILYLFKIVGIKTDVRLSVQVDLGNSEMPAERVAERQVRKQYKENLILLKSILETSQVEQSMQLPAWENQPRES